MASPLHSVSRALSVSALLILAHLGIPRASFGQRPSPAAERLFSAVDAPTPPGMPVQRSDSLYLPGDEALAQSCPGGADLAPAPPLGGYIFHGYAASRGIPEGSGNNNNGLVFGINYGARLGEFSEATGIGAQLGATYAMYDFYGRSSGFSDNQSQQQGFVTGGLFRNADRLTDFSGGVAFDAMFNSNFGQFAASPFLGQLRAQVAYAIHEQHEIGFWTAIRMIDDEQNINGTLAFRGVDQFNLFWHHKFEFGGDAWGWFGIPDHTKLGGNGSLGDYIFGGSLVAPLSPHFGVYTDLQYMAPSASPGNQAAQEETFYLALGVILYPARRTPHPNVVNRSWMPYLPVANNGSFMVDTNRTF